LDKFEFKGRALTSSTKDGGWNYGGDMAVNLPLVDDKLAARLVGGYKNLSGWIDRPLQKDANSYESKNVRLKLNAQPTEKLSVGVAAWASWKHNGAPALSNDNAFNGSLLEEPTDETFKAYSAKFTYEFSAFTLKNMAGYINFKQEPSYDLGG